jgi:hypothetical protein
MNKYIANPKHYILEWIGKNYHFKLRLSFLFLRIFKLRLSKMVFLPHPLQMIMMGCSTDSALPPLKTDGSDRAAPSIPSGHDCRNLVVTPFRELKSRDWHWRGPRIFRGAAAMGLLLLPMVPLGRFFVICCLQAGTAETLGALPTQTL